MTDTEKRPITFDDEPAVSGQKARVVFIVDASGSMRTVAEETVQFFNNQVEAIQTSSRDVATRVSLMTFSDVSKDLLWDEPVELLQPWTVAQYKPGGNTALRDAVGRAIERLDKDPDISDPNTSVLFIIITDGAENASRRVSQEQLAALIRDRQDTGRWTFTYMGANQDLSKIVREMNIPVMNTVSYDSSPIGTMTASAVAASSTRSYFSARSSGKLSVSNFYAGNEDVPVTTSTTTGGKSIIDKINDLNLLKPTTEK